MKRRVFAALVSLLLMSTYLLAGCSSESSKNNDTLEAEMQSDTSEATTSSTYEDKLFDTSYVHEINIEIADSDWQDLLKNPTEKTKYEADVTIDGETISDISFATKGNTSLSQVAADENSDRYSFKINFGKNVDGQTYYGLDKLDLNNIMSDSTYMKDYLSYQIMEAAGVDASLSSYASISINGELFGLYLAIEDVSDSYLERNYGDDYGELYKPETEQLDNMDKAAGGGGAQGDKQMPDKSLDPADDLETDGKAQTEADTGMNTNDQSAGDTGIDTSDAGSTPKIPSDLTDEQKEEFENRMENGDMDRPSGRGGMMDSGSKGADLVYTDNEVDSYSDIFDNAETDAEEEDKKRLIAALEQLSTGEDLESGVDIEEVLRYFVAHNFVDNYDSYTGTMLHNYYLYESDGILSLLPWDYNLSFGAFSSDSTATELVNWAIDTPLSGTTEEERPIWGKLIENEEYLNQYHEYFDELITKYFESGDCEAEIERVHDMIASYVAADPSAFYTLEEFETAVSTLETFCELRAESIRKQLDGVIPSTTEKQKEEDVELIDASTINLSDMGTQKGAGGIGKMDMPAGGRNR
ncbi:MAG: CotH kinase family protein [Anaerocolumna sp.]